MTSPDKAIRLVHASYSTAVWYDTALNLGRGTKGSLDALEQVRMELFVEMVGRDPTEEELVQLLEGDA